MRKSEQRYYLCELEYTYTAVGHAMVYKKLNCEVQFVNVVCRTYINKVAIEKHIVRLVQSIRYQTITGVVLLVLVIMNASDELVLHIILNAQGGWHWERYSLEATCTRQG